MKKLNKIYTKEFYDNLEKGSYSSAKNILPLVLNLSHPKSVVDIGCGIGTWLKVCQQLKIRNLLGLDGKYVNKKLFKLDPQYFLATDLNKPIKIKQKFDLLICLEVAEHLPPNRAKSFIASLTSLSDTVLFSSAIPLQGGKNHLNEQWPSYWAKKFHKNNFSPVDFIRPQIWNNSNVEWWYRQNVVLFVKDSVIKKNPKINSLYQQHKKQPLSIVHPIKYIEQNNILNHSMVKFILTLPIRVNSFIQNVIK